MILQPKRQHQEAGGTFPLVFALEQLSTGELSYGMPYEQQARARISDGSVEDGERGFVYSQMAFGYVDM